jgi:electron transfer flavoprotein beta subunit
MRICVLLKPVPETTGDERFGADMRVDREATAPVINPNDEYALEAALRLKDERSTETRLTLLSMAPPSAEDTLRKGLAVGADDGVLVSDLALEGSCALVTSRILAAALRKLQFDLVVAGTDTSDGRGGVVPAAISVFLDLPYLSGASKVLLTDSSVSVQRPAATGGQVLESPLPAIVGVTQTVGELRYPTMRGIISARSKEIRTLSLADLGLSAEDGGAAATSRVLDVVIQASRPPTRIVTGPPAEVARQLVEFLAGRSGVR